MKKVLIFFVVILRLLILEFISTANVRPNSTIYKYIKNFQLFLNSQELEL